MPYPSRVKAGDIAKIIMPVGKMVLVQTLETHEQLRLPEKDIERIEEVTEEQAIQNVKNAFPGTIET